MRGVVRAIAGEQDLCRVWRLSNSWANMLYSQQPLNAFLCDFMGATPCTGTPAQFCPVPALCRRQSRPSAPRSRWQDVCCSHASQHVKPVSGSPCGSFQRKLGSFLRTVPRKDWGRGVVLQLPIVGGSRPTRGGGPECPGLGRLSPSQDEHDKCGGIGFYADVAAGAQTSGLRGTKLRVSAHLRVHSGG